MAVRLFCGRAGTGKTSRIFQEIEAEAGLFLKEKKNCFLLVPEQFTLQTERDLLSKTALNGLLGIEVLSLPRLAERVLHEKYFSLPVFLKEQGKQMLLRKILKEKSQDLSFYGKSMDKEGFVPLLSQTVTLLKQNDFEKFSMAELSQASVVLQEKMQDIRTLYNAFESCLAEKYLDMEDYLNRFQAGIATSEYLKNAVVWVDGFDKYTPQDLQIFEALISKVNRITFTFTLEREETLVEQGLFDMPRYFFEKIRSSAQRQKQTVELIDFKEQLNNDKGRALAYLEKNLFRLPLVTYQEHTDEIMTYKGEDLAEETDRVADEMIRLARKGYRWRDMMIICNDMESYLPYLVHALNEKSIPYFLDIKKNIFQNPVIGVLLAALEVVRNNFRQEDVLRYMKLGFNDLTVDVQEAVENYALKYGIKHQKWQESFKYDEELELQRRLLLEPLIDLAQGCSGCACYRDFTEKMMLFLEKIRLAEQVERWLAELQSQAAYGDVYESLQIWDILLEVWDQMEAFLGDEVCDLGSYASIFKSGLGAYDIGIIPTTIDQVLIGSMKRTKTRDVQAMFVVGVTEGIIPKAQDNLFFFSRDEGEYLAGSGLLPEKSERLLMAEERFLLYQMVSRAEKFLWFSFPQKDGEGKSLRPALLIDQISKLLPQMKVKSYDQNKPVDYLSTPQGTFKYFVRALRAAWDGQGDQDKLWHALAAWYRSDLYWQQEVERVFRGLGHNNQAFIEPEHWQKNYSRVLKTSISRVETFLKCPFSYFTKYELRPRERKLHRIELPDVGCVFHESIAVMTEELAKKNQDWRLISEEDVVQAWEDSYKKVAFSYQEGVFADNARNKYVMKRVAEIGRISALKAVNQIKAGDFVPWGVEVAFSDKGKLPAMEIPLAGADKAVLEGVIDRVDWIQDEEHIYYRVIDYKTGNKKFSLKELYYGISLQLPLYLKAVLSGSGAKKALPAGMFYFKMQEPCLTGSEIENKETWQESIDKTYKLEGTLLGETKVAAWMDNSASGYSKIIPVQITKTGFSKKSAVLAKDDFQSILDYAGLCLQTACERILAGNIAIRPFKDNQKTACEFCDFRAFCQFDNRLQNNGYRYLNDFEKDELMDKIQEKLKEVDEHAVDR